MIFKNSFHLLVDNFSLVYKYLLYKIVVWAIAVALAAAFIFPNVNFLLGSEQFNAVIDLLQDFFKALVSGNTEFLSSFPDHLKSLISDLGAFLASNTTRLVLLAVAVVGVILVVRFLSGLGNFVFGALLDDKLSSYAKTSFSGTLIKNLGKASLWQIIYVPVTFIYDVVVLVVCYLLFLTLLSVINYILIAAYIAMMLSIALFLVTQSIKLTVFSNLVPAMVSDKLKLSAAFKKSFSLLKGNFGPLFSNYLVTAFLILFTYGCSVALTFGAGLFFAIPMSFVMLICIQFVSFYTFDKRKYFISQDKIIFPKESKEDEDFYDNFEF